jgi:3-phosphoshikimate 1-carboxyvinyltransferase
LGLKATSEMVIEEAQAVNKSYPDFYNDLKSLGADVPLPFQHLNL